MHVCMFACMHICIHTCVRVWRSGSVMDCYATARGAIPCGNGVFTELHVLRKGRYMGVPSLNDLAFEGT